MSLPLLDASGKAINPGRFLNIIDGIQGVAAGGVANINLAVNQRVHRVKLKCQAVNYTGGTALATTALTGGGNNALTVTFTATNGVPNALTVVAAGSGYAVNDTFSVTDPTGTGGVFKVLTISGSTVLTASYNALSATASPIDPGALLSTCKLLVNGTVMRDISARLTLMLSQAVGVNGVLGDLDFYFTEPSRNWIRNNEATSWDLAGQNTFVISPTINSGYLSPSITGEIEFDYLRNSKTVNGVAQANLEPITHHIQTPLIGGSASGTINAITTIPINYPIARLWLLGSSPGNITALELIADGAKRLEGSVTDINSMYEKYGFQFGQAGYLNQNQTSAKPLGFNPVNYFDTAFISDVSGRYSRALRCVQSLSLRVTSTTAQTLTIMVEALPGNYSS